MVEETLTVTTGGLMRRRFRSALPAAGLYYDVDIKWSEAKSFLASQFVIKVTGEETNVKRFIAQLEEWGRERV